MSRLTYVVLAAGASTRMGFDKTVRRQRGLAPLERLALALAQRPAVVVVPTRLSHIASTMIPHATIVANDEPSRGMTHSLHVALRAVDLAVPFGVLLGDMPAMTQATLLRTEALMAPNIDVAFPVGIDGAPGHPVLFSVRARRVVEALAQGDTLRRARDDSSLTRATWTCTDRSAFLDLDVPSEWEAFRA